jgi:O-antigen/teichoic acid export membrane protein
MTSNPQASLKSRMLRASSWVLIGHVAGMALKMISSLITTRLLMPEVFGVVAIAMAVIVIIALLSDIGLRESLIQSRRGDEREFQDTAWTVQVIRGGITWIGTSMFVVGLYLANKYGLIPAGSTYATPVLPAVLLACSFVAVIQSFRSTKMFTANRHFSLARLTQIELISQLIGMAVTVGGAWMTRSVWAVVAGMVISTLATVLLSQYWLPGPRNRFHWDKGALHELMEFGRWVFISSAVSVLAMNGDRILLGGFVGAETLGLYSIAVLIAGAIEGALSKLMSVVSFPALSEIVRTAPQRLPSVLTRLRLYSDSVLLFVAGLLFATGQLLIDLLYDHRYAAAGQMLRILSFTMVASRYSMLNQAYLAMGYSKYLAWINVVSLAALFIAVPLAYRWFGFAGAIAVIATKNLATVPLIFRFNAKHQLNNFKLEAGVLLVWPLGYGAGMLLMRLMGRA